MDVNVNSTNPSPAPQANACPHCGMATQVVCTGCNQPVANCTCQAQASNDTVNINA